MSAITVPLTDAELRALRPVLRDAWRRAHAFGPARAKRLLALQLVELPSGRMALVGSVRALTEFLEFVLLASCTPLAGAYDRRRASSWIALGTMLASRKRSGVRGWMRYEAAYEAVDALTDGEINALLQLASDEDAELRNEEVDFALESADAQESGGISQETAAGTQARGDSRGGAEARDDRPTEVDDDLSDVPFDLERQTDDDIRRQEAQRRKDEAKAEREAAEQAKRDAAPDAGDFTLTGSDRAADEATVRGQRELVPAPTEESKSPTWGGPSGLRSPRVNRPSQGSAKKVLTNGDRVQREVMSRGGTSTGLPVAEVVRIAEALRQIWAIAPEIIVAGSLADPRVPQAVREAERQRRAVGSVMRGLRRSWRRDRRAGNSGDARAVRSPPRRPHARAPTERRTGGRITTHLARVLALTGRDVMGWLVRHHVAAEAQPDPVAEGTVEHQVRTLLERMQPCTVYAIAASMGISGRAVVRSAIRRLEAKGIVERDHMKVLWHFDHPVTKTWWRLAGSHFRGRECAR